MPGRDLLLPLWLLLTGAMDAAASEPAESIAVEVVAEGLQQPWSLAFIDERRWLITERAGQLRALLDGQLQPPIGGVPTVHFAGQGGLLDVLIDPDFATNQRLYLSYAHGDATANATRVIRARLVDQHLTDVRVLFTAQPSKATSVHYGGRLLMLPDGSLLLSLGDGFDERESAQDLATHLGKIVRFGRDGEIPLDNPFSGRNDALPEIWTLGHRNVQGLSLDPLSGAVYAHEHGPRGGDEINRIEPGRNYGWPLATFGVDYSGALISPFQRYPDTEAPLQEWTPSIAPSALAFVDGPQFATWRGDLLVTALAGKALHHLRRDDDGKLLELPPLLAERQQRLRDVRMGPDGAIYVLTDGADAQLLRLTPAPTNGPE
ncbi:MAG: PQQ-dependent sugar dehydrogenase [Xanthomonadales bacterium]|nr:PQQ-dependent sugar dehydrogenase [Xanthomonadales bacterium]